MYDEPHRIWRIVSNNWRTMEEHAPDGYEPVTFAHLVGSPEAIPINRVETHKDTGLTMLFVVSPGEGPEGHPEDRFIFVDRDRIAHVEIRYERTGKKSIGFEVRESEVEASVS